MPVQWEPLLAGAVGGYAVERALGAEGPFARVTSLPGRLNTVWVDRGENDAPKGGGGVPSDLGDGVTYFYRVRALAWDGSPGTATSEVVAATTAPPPARIEGLRAYSHQPRRVPLSWGPADDPHVAGYVVYRSPTSLGPFESLVEIDGRFATVYVDRDLGDLRVFHYRVSARNTAGGEGEPSEVVRAVTKAEPLPPVGLRVVERRLGSNRLAWDPNVESDLAEYRLLRIRDGADAPQLVAVLPPDVREAIDGEVGADERIRYTLVAIDHDGLESGLAEPLEVQGEGYALTATPTGAGVRLEWNSRLEEGYGGAHILRRGRITQRELRFVQGSSYVDPEVKPGATYRYTIVLERPDESQAPPSSSVEVTVPSR